MLSASCAWFCLLALSLSFSGPHLALFQPQASSQSPAQVAEEATLRRLTEQYASAIEAGNLPAIREFWNPQSPNLAARLRTYQSLASEARIEFLNPKVTRLEVTGNRGVSQLTADTRRLDRKTGAVLMTHDPFRDSCYSIEWVKTAAGWKIEREFLVQDELAARLEAATSEPARDQLLEKERLLVTNTLIGALASRGMRHHVQGNDDAALRCFELQEVVADRIGDRAGAAGAWLNSGLVKDTLEDHELGLQLMHKALALYEALGLKRGMALALENLASLYRAIGNQRRAFDYAQKSLQLCEETKHRRGIAVALAELASIYGSQNNSEQALAHLERALPIAQELKDVVLLATLRHDVGVQHMKLGNYQPALEIYQELLKQTAASGDRGGAAMIRSQFGQILAAQGKYAEALIYYNQALTELEMANAKRATAIVLSDVSGVYLAQGKYAEALPPAERAVALSRETGRQLDLWWALTCLGYSQSGLNRVPQARKSFAEAVTLIEKLRAQIAGGIGESQRYFEAGLRAHHGLLALLVKDNQVPEALILAERAKARALLDLLQQGKVSVQKAMTLKEQEQERRLKAELTQLNRQLGNATQTDRSEAANFEALESRLEKTRLQYEAFQNSLYAAHPELKIQRGEAPLINVQELAPLLPDAASALLEYVVTDDETYLFVITKTTAKAEAETRVYTLAVKREQLTKAVEAFRQQLATRDLGFRASATRLFDLLLKPATAQLRGKSNLIIAADDKLWDLPFQALLTGNNRFLIEDTAIAYAPSLTVLREMSSRRRPQDENAGSTTLLALGNPLLRKETINRAALRDEKLDPLPEAEQEVKALKQLYGATHSKVYTGAEAREDRAKLEAARARILHFATHGTLNNASPMYSHLALAEGGAGEDGLLEAWELMQLDLHAELAVLSACETARGRIGAGEGMIGFSWAMFIAGVPATVVSQWKVESAGTRDLMVNFHRALMMQSGAEREPITKAEALRQAALKVMRQDETRHPFYWAGFVLVGNGR